MRSVTTREPLYTEQDRAELLALQLYRDRLCPLHGGPRSECEATDDHMPDWSASSSYCHATVALIEAQAAASDPNKPNRYAPAKLWRTTPRR